MGFLIFSCVCRGILIDDHHTHRRYRDRPWLSDPGSSGRQKRDPQVWQLYPSMDETLVLCAVDLCGRPYFSWDAQFPTEKIGGMSTEMVREFFYAVSYSAQMNLHIKVLTPGNSHHMAEAMFKSFAKALDMAVSFDPRITDVLSTKGSL